MTLSARRKLVLPSAIASAVIFAAMTVPLAIMGDKQVGIQIEKESFFYGRLRDIAAPYVVFATLLSCGAGISVAALAGWHHYTKKSLNYKKELFQIKERLRLKEELLQEFKFSESRLQISGLSSFLNEQNLNSQPVVAQNSELVSKNNRILKDSDSQNGIYSSIDSNVIDSNRKDVSHSEIHRDALRELRTLPFGRDVRF